LSPRNISSTLLERLHQQWNSSRARASLNTVRTQCCAPERQLEIVGEALAQLARIDPATASRISEYRRIVAVRNILIHGYAEIDHRLVWDVLETKLPVLHREAETLLSAGTGD